MRTENRPGELGEATFLLRATERGWVVSKPFGEKQCYDFIVDNGRNLLRVQVKSTEAPCSKHRYHINLGRGGGARIPYQKNQIDFFAIYLVQENAWYILPIEAAMGWVGLSVPKTECVSGTAYEKYSEAWGLMDGGGEWSGRADLNCRPLAPQASALPG